jgi:hypothetical protein
MTEELVCPNCHVSLDERQLLTNTWTVESCPHCRATVRKQEGFRWHDRDAMVLEDVTAIETWLVSVTSADPLLVVQRADEEAKGKCVWKIDEHGTAGIFYPWKCTVEYSSDTPNIFAVRLTTSQNGKAFIENPKRLQILCADDGVQPHAERWSGVDWSGQHSEVRWGVQQFLSTRTLSESLFRAVVKRLNHAMRNASAQPNLAQPSA